MEAYVLVKTSGPKVRGILEEIRKLDGVVEAHGLYGPYDIIVRLRADDLAGLVVDKMRKIYGVADTMTMIVAL